jgi:Kynurenine formamidase (EC 3.5.1.9)
LFKLETTLKYKAASMGVIEMKKYYDVSLSINENMIVYPGNPAPSIERYSAIPKNKVNESVIKMGSHTGTHADTKLHIKNDEPGAEFLSLDSFFGKCRVLDLTHIEQEIHCSDLEYFNIGPGEIILLKTKNSMFGYDAFRKDFIHIKIDAAEYLVNAGIKTLGFDYLSVKKFGGDEEVHEMLINNMTLFEGLDLKEVPEGEYTFIGLPLRINTDGAPARVLLVEEE